MSYYDEPIETDAPKVQKRCEECGRAHYDKNYSVCVECGALLPEA